MPPCSGESWPSVRRRHRPLRREDARPSEGYAPDEAFSENLGVRRITVRPAESGDAAGIARVCAEGWRDTYAGLYTPEHVESVVAEYYTVERIAREDLVALRDASLSNAALGADQTVPAPIG